MEQYALYLALKQMLKDLNGEFKYSFNDMDINGENIVGVFVRGGESPRRRELKTGKYYNLSARVQFLVQGKNDKVSLMNVTKLSSDIRNTLSTTFNRYIRVLSQVRMVNGELVYTESGEEIAEEEQAQVLVISTSLLGEVDFKGKTAQGKPMYSLNFKILYTVL